MAINPISLIAPSNGGGIDDEELLRLQMQHLMRGQNQRRQPQNIQHWTQGAAHVMDQIGDSMQQRMLMQALKDRQAKSREADAGLMGSILGTGKPTAPTAGGGTQSYAETRGIKPEAPDAFPAMAADPGMRLPTPTQPVERPQTANLFPSSPGDFPMPIGAGQMAMETPVPSGEGGMPAMPDFMPSAPPAPPQITPPQPQIAERPPTRGRINMQGFNPYEPPAPTPSAPPQQATAPMGLGMPEQPPQVTEQELTGEAQPPSAPMQGEAPPVPQRNMWNRMQARMEIPNGRVNNPAGNPIPNPQGVIAHDTSGTNPFGLGRGGNPMYNITVGPDGRIIAPRGVHQTDMGPAFGKAPHAAAYNGSHLGVARVGREGEPLTPEARSSLGLVNAALSQRYGLSPEQFNTHPGMGRLATRSGGKDPREANWLPSTLPSQEAPAAPQRQPFGGVQVADAGGQITADVIQDYIRKGGDPRKAWGLVEMEMQRRQRQSDPDRLLERRKTEAEIKRIENPPPQGETLRLYDLWLRQGGQGTITDFIRQQNEAKRGQSSGDKKYVYEAQDELPSIDGAISTLQEAKALAPKVYTGIAPIASSQWNQMMPGLPNVFTNDEQSKATLRYNQIMSQQAIEQMSATLKGATTDQELNQFKDILANPRIPVEIKQKAIDDMITRAERKRKILIDRIGELGGKVPEFARPQSGQSGGGWGIRRVQ